MSTPRTSTNDTTSYPRCWGRCWLCWWCASWRCSDCSFACFLQKYETYWYDYIFDSLVMITSNFIRIKEINWSQFFLDPTTTKLNSLNISYFYMILTDKGNFRVTFTKHSSILSGLLVRPSDEPIVESPNCEYGWSMLVEESSEVFRCDVPLSFANGAGKRNLKTKQLISLPWKYRKFSKFQFKGLEVSPVFQPYAHCITFNGNNFNGFLDIMSTHILWKQNDNFHFYIINKYGKVH